MILHAYMHACMQVAVCRRACKCAAAARVCARMHGRCVHTLPHTACTPQPAWAHSHLTRTVVQCRLQARPVQEVDLARWLGGRHGLGLSLLGRRPLASHCVVCL